MQSPVRIELERARVLMASVLLAHGAAGLALFLASSKGWVLSAGGALIAVSFWLAWRAETFKRGLCLQLMADGGVLLMRGDEPPLIASPGRSAVAFRFVIWLELDLPSTGHPYARRLHLMLLPSHLRCGQWRSLQVWIRHRLPGAVTASA